MTLFSRLVWLQLLVWTAATAAFRISSYRPSLSLYSSCNKQRVVATTPWTLVPRGGSTNVSEDDDEEESEDEEEVAVDEEMNDEEESDDEEESEDEESEESEEDGENPLNTVISSEPIKVSVKTNLGSPLVDTSLELLVSRTRNVGSIKKSLSKQMPGRPPISAQQLMLDGRILQDDLLVDELVEEEEDDDDEEDSLKLVLNMVPPVDPKFATDFLERTKSMSASDMLDAYAANAAAMYHNSQLLSSSDDNDGETNLRKETLEIREMVVQSIPEDALELLKEQDVQDENPLEKQRRGQRLRTGRGGAKQNIKSVLQRNLNINWSDTIRNFILFLLFGIFGGRNTVSKHLLLLGAPLCFVLQARPVKIWLKLGFYLARDPPSILLSLLPAPQQAILSFDAQQSRTALYGPVENDGEEEGEDGGDEIMEQDDYDDYDNEEMEQEEYDDEEVEQEEFDDYDDETEDDYD